MGCESNIHPRPRFRPLLVGPREVDKVLNGPALHQPLVRDTQVVVDVDVVVGTLMVVHTRHQTVNNEQRVRSVTMEAKDVPLVVR